MRQPLHFGHLEQVPRVIVEGTEAISNQIPSFVIYMYIITVAYMKRGLPYFFEMGFFHDDSEFLYINIYVYIYIYIYT